MASSGFPVGLKQNGHDGTLIFVRNNTPPAGEYANHCPFGGLVLDIVAGVLWQNTGTTAVPVFTVYGATPPSPMTLPAVVKAGNLPTADPHSVGQLWSSSGVLTVSAG